MIKLNLVANTEPQKRILAYLEENVSEVLADKINNGTTITKEDKQLINKKSLDGFMKYACEEARKQAEKGANSACVEDSVVYGWAIHYFEEDSIEGALYNLDGTEFKPVVKTTTKKTTPQTKIVTKQKQQDSGIKQTSFFDLVADEEKQTENVENQSKIDTNVVESVDNTDLEDDNIEVEEPDDLDALLESIEEEQEKEQQNIINPYYSNYLEVGERYPNNVIIQKYGDFYEIFDEFAVELSRKFNLTLTTKDVGLSNRIQMVGFPCYAAEKYLNNIRQHYNVTIIEDKEIKQLSQIVMVAGVMIDKETGEILTEGVCDNKQTSSLLDNELMQYLNNLLDNKVKFI